MSSIDDFFKKPVLPSQKRKLEPLRNPNEPHKAPKLNGADSAHSRDAGSTAQEGAGQDSSKSNDDDDDLEAGPELPPDFDEDEQDGLEGDDEGRFFGGGISGSMQEAIRYLDTADGEEVIADEKYDIAWLRKLALNFEKKINKNAELRAKFETEPEKFVGSEADLDAEIKALSLLSEHPELYRDFAKLGSTVSLVGLLAHENTDIALDAVEIVGELIDDDVEATDEQWNTLVDSLVDADLLSLLHANLERLDEDQEEDRAGVYKILSVIESLASRSALADKVAERHTLFSWLTGRVKRKEQHVSQNKQYAAELCAILLQTSRKNRDLFIQDDLVDSFLQLLSTYRKRDPEKGSDEEEYMENLFDCLTCVVDEETGKQKFVDAEGTELCLIMLKEGKASRPRAFRLLDHALSGPGSTASCQVFVEAAGLKPLFTTLMKKQDFQMIEHILGILSSLLRFLSADSAPRIRLLAKFVEKDYQKIDRLATLKAEYKRRLDRADETITKERANAAADELSDLEPGWLSRRLEAGLFVMQSLDVILAWIAAEDEGARRKIQSTINLSDIRKSLQNQIQEAEGEARDMFEALLAAM